MRGIKKRNGRVRTALGIPGVEREEKQHLFSQKEEGGQEWGLGEGGGVSFPSANSSVP